MDYVMTEGMLYEEGQNHLCARLKGRIAGPEKRILSADGQVALQTVIRRTADAKKDIGDVRGKEYVVEDGSRKEYITAKPDYAPDESPSENGWPLCRMPKVDRAQVAIGEKEYRLRMQSSWDYELTDPAGQTVVHVTHRGMKGGWKITAPGEFAPELVCGLFVLCRYMEQENEFIAV